MIIKKVNNIYELGSTYVNITVALLDMQKKKITLNIKDMNININLDSARDVLELCTQLLIDQEFETDFIDIPVKKESQKIYKNTIQRSKLDPHANKIVTLLNSEVSIVSIIKKYSIGQTAFAHWRRTRTKVNSKGIVELI